MGITCEALDKEISALKAGKMTWDTVKQLNLLLDLRAKLGDDAGHGERLTDSDCAAMRQTLSISVVPSMLPLKCLKLSFTFWSASAGALSSRWA